MNHDILSTPSDQQKLNGATLNASSTTPNPQNEQTLATSGYENWQAIAAREPFYWNDIHSLRFVIQIVFSTVILLFCLTQLVASKENKNDAIYWGGVTGILALWMPSPSSPGANQRNQANIGSVNNPQIRLDSTGK
ncbi:hypothetical protein H6G27_31610 [Nostoc linckia FACHB-104]|nr:hypothetical protein [Nostoc linckia FACHB-104]